MKSKDLVTKQAINHERAALKIFASLLVILSGLVLFSDKVTTFGITETFGFKSVKTFIWVFTQTLSPLLLCFGAFLKPYKASYFVPTYFYFIQMYWVFNARTLGLDDVLLHVYATGFSFLSFIFLLFIGFVIKQLSKTNQILLLNIRKLTRHTLKTIREKYIQEGKTIKKEDIKEYTIDSVNVIDSLD